MLLYDSPAWVCEVGERGEWVVDAVSCPTPVTRGTVGGTSPAVPAVDGHRPRRRATAPPAPSPSTHGAGRPLVGGAARPRPPPVPSTGAVDHVRRRRRSPRRSPQPPRRRRSRAQPATEPPEPTPRRRRSRRTGAVDHVARRRRPPATNPAGGGGTARHSVRLTVSVPSRPCWDAGHSPATLATRTRVRPRS